MLNALTVLNLYSEFLLQKPGWFWPGAQLLPNLDLVQAKVTGMSVLSPERQNRGSHW
jgi:hypothetical protein